VAIPGKPFAFLKISNPIPRKLGNVTRFSQPSGGQSDPKKRSKRIFKSFSRLRAGHPPPPPTFNGSPGVGCPWGDRGTPPSGFPPISRPHRWRNGLTGPPGPAAASTAAAGPPICLWQVRGKFDKLIGQRLQKKRGFNHCAPLREE